MNSYEYVKNYRKRQKESILYVMGEECAICGYFRCSQALELHHLDPEQKDFTIGQNTNRAWEKVVAELPKTVLLCANCHREVHAGLIDESLLVSTFDENKAKEITDKIEDVKVKHPNHCPICGKEIDRKANYCVDCYNQMRTKDRPSREVLKNDIRTMSMLKVGKKYGISDNGIRKWCDAYSLPRRKTEIDAYSDEEWEKI